jgi:hypothetical protein
VERGGCGEKREHKLGAREWEWGDLERVFSERVDLKKLRKHNGLPAASVLPLNVIRIRAKRLPTIHTKAVNKLRQQRVLSASWHNRLRPTHNNHDPQHSKQVHDKGPFGRDWLLLREHLWLFVLAVRLQGTCN